MSPTELLAALTLLVGVPLNLYATVKLLRLARHSANPVLRERTIVAVIVLLTVAVFGLIFVNNDTLPPPLNLVLTKLVTRLMVLTLAIVPALYWIYLYRAKAS